MGLHSRAVAAAVLVAGTRTANGTPVQLRASGGTAAQSCGTTREISANALMWRFFAQHTLAVA